MGILRLDSIVPTGERASEARVFAVTALRSPLPEPLACVDEDATGP